MTRRTVTARRTLPAPTKRWLRYQMTAGDAPSAAAVAATAHRFVARELDVLTNPHTGRLTSGELANLLVTAGSVLNREGATGA